MNRSFSGFLQNVGLILRVGVGAMYPALAFSTPAGVSPFVIPASEPIYYGHALCNNADYHCITVKSGDSWENLFPNPKDMDLVQRVNRTYNRLISGQNLVVPKSLSSATLFDLAPFPLKITDTERQIIVDQDKLAWAAYNQAGELVKWGPIASGRDKCSDSANSCRTLTGVYRVFSKEDSHCKSDIFPIGKGGAKMPYCMYFHKGFALHGADDMPGYRASHGCVRLFNEDAKWLNLNFVEASNEANHQKGTKIVVRPVTAPSTFYARRTW